MRHRADFWLILRTQYTSFLSLRVSFSIDHGLYTFMCFLFLKFNRKRDTEGQRGIVLIPFLESIRHILSASLSVCMYSFFTKLNRKGHTEGQRNCLDFLLESIRHLFSALFSVFWICFLITFIRKGNNEGQGGSVSISY